ncbi:MAG: sulfite exporter TauE/SafE family protein [Pseudomonadota bacterium]
MPDITTILIVAPVLLGVGAIAGTLAGLLGVGGGIVIVPALFWLTQTSLLGVAPDVAMHFAVATSLATIIPTSISSARAHHRKGSVDMTLFRAWAPFVAVGALGGGLLAVQVDAAVLTGIFGVIAILVSLNMLNPRPFTLADAPPSSFVGRGSIAVPIGGFSATMGIGGGTLSVPVLTLLSFPVHRAVGTAALFGLVISIPGVVSFALAGQDIDGVLPGSLGYINVPAAIAISVATFLFAPLGVRIAHKLNANRLRLVFAVFLGVSAVRMLIAAFAA